MSEQVEKVTLPFEDMGSSDPASEPVTAGALALLPGGGGPAPLASAEDAIGAAPRAAGHAHAWGLTIPSDFTPATKAQVAYWRDLCGAISLTGTTGMRDGAWPADLAPSKPTLTAMAERGLIVRRGRAWRLKRRWYPWLQYLRETAVPTPALTVAERPAPHLPTYAELKQYEALCRWLDGQPHCRVRLPLQDVPGVGVVSPVLLQAMRKQKLVRHTYDCFWTLSKKWQALLLSLWQGRTKQEGERTPAPCDAPSAQSVACGLDTFYVNRIDRDGLPAQLHLQLEDLQDLARANDAEVDTPWRYDGAPLVMYRAGVNTTQGGGVSWSYILRNPSLTLLIRKTPFGGIVAQARLGSECLWRLTPLRAMNALDALVKRMWRDTLCDPRKQRGGEAARWQVSQAHLCHDVANAPLSLDQLDRYVSRSRQQSAYAVAQEDLQRLYAVVDGRRGDQEGADVFDPTLDLPFDLTDELPGVKGDRQRRESSGKRRYARI